MDDIKLMLDRLSELSNEEIEALNEQILTQFDSVESQEYTPETVETMTALADALDAVKAEARSREAQAEELAARAAEATTRVREVAGEAEVIESEEDAVEEAEEEPEAVEASASDEAATDASETAEFASAETEAATAVPDEEKEEDDEVEEDVVVDAPEETQTPEDEEEEELDFTSEAAPAATENTDADSEFTAEAAEAPEAEETPTPTDEPIPAQEEESLVAATTDGAFEAPADRRPVEAAATEIPVAITAGADIPGVSAGSTLTSMSDIANLMDKRLHTIRNVHGGDGEQHIVASISTEYPTDRLLTGNAKETMARLEKASNQEAVVASGGWPGPLEFLGYDYNIGGLPSSLARPIRDSLPRFQADRGGVRYMVPPLLGAYEDAVGVWTGYGEDSDDVRALNNYDTEASSVNGLKNRPKAPLPGPLKKVMIVDGAHEREAVLDAITLQLQVGNLYARAYPEMLERHNELALIQHARLAETTLYNKMKGFSTPLTSGKVLGFARDFLVQARRAGAAFRSRHRIDARTNLRAIVPTWVVDAIAADLIMQMPGDDTLRTSIQQVNALIADAGITITETPDLGGMPVQEEGALVDFPTSFEWLLFPDNSFVFLDGGTLDLGVIRDSTLVSTNDYRMFVETFEGLAFLGVESFAITSSLRVTGEAAALADTTPADTTP